MDTEMDRKQQVLDIFNSLFTVNQFLQRVGNRQIVQYGLNQAHFKVLGEIIRNVSMAQSDIKGELLLEKSNLSKIVKKLKEMELIKLTPADDDRRKEMISSTERGRQLWNECMADLNYLKQRFFEPMKDREVELIHAAMIHLSELSKFHINRR